MLPHRNAGDHIREPKEFLISMKRSLAIVCMLASGLGLSAMAQAGATDPAPGAAPAVAPAGGTKIAIIAIQPAVMQTNEGQRNFSELQKKYEPKRQQLKQMSDEIDGLKKQLQSAGNNLSDTERQNRLRTIDDKEKEYQRLGEDTQNDFQQDLQQTYQQLAEKVYNVLQAYAEQPRPLGQRSHKHYQCGHPGIQPEVRRPCSGCWQRSQRPVGPGAPHNCTSHHDRTQEVDTFGTLQKKDPGYFGVF